MSSCSNCDCADKINCPKKGNAYGVEVIVTEKSCYDGATVSGENNGKCKCGPNCTCTTCTCGH